LILATGGQRVREVVEARIDEFDLEKLVWTIPGARTKNEREHSVPLTATAVDIINTTLHGNDSRFLFPNARDPERPMAFTAVGRAVTRFCERSGAEHWTPRDIRRTARTMLSDAEEPNYRLDVYLNHGTTVGVGEKHYDKSRRLADKSKTMEVWGNLLMKMLETKQEVSPSG